MVWQKHWLVDPALYLPMTKLATYVVLKFGGHTKQKSFFESVD